MHIFVFIILISSAFNKSIINQIENSKLTVDTKTLVKNRVEKYGYLFEEYKLTTTDGYINTIYRIPGKKGYPKTPKDPVMILHGIDDTAYTFLNLKENSIPFILVNEGHDVWLANTRGQYLSHDHIKYDYSDINGEYWEYTIDDLVKYDLPETIEFIKKKTGYSKIDYIGHSQGVAIVLLSFLNNPSYIKSNINKFVGLAGVTSLAKSKNKLFILVSKIVNFLRDSFLVPKRISFFNDLIHLLLAEIAKNFPDFANALADFICSLKRSYLTKVSDYPEWFYVLPGGSSKYVFIQWLQNLIQKKWRKFDYGKEKNIEKYGTEVPPEYNEDNYKDWDIPSLFTVSDNDAFINIEDFMDFYNKIGHKENVTLVDAKGFNHIDTIHSPSILKEIVPKIVQFLKH